MSDEANASADPTFEPPSPEELAHMLPQYHMEGFIAQGGMGAVYLARQPALDRHVAIKVLPPYWGGEMDFAARFQIEARAMAKLQHSNIVSVYDFGQTAMGHLYLVMEYVDGHTLHEFIQSGTVTVQHALSYSLQLCDALQYAHEHGIIHRDIEPANVLISNEGRVKVADFGLARPTAAQHQEIMMGTPDYAAPEIAQGETVDQRADIFALGVLIYEMLTGVTPMQGRKLASTLKGVDPAWDDVASKATRPLPQERFQSVKDMRGAISLVANRRRYAPGAGQPAQTTPKRGGGATMTLAGVLAAALVLGGLYFWSHSQRTTGPNAEEPAKVTQAETSPSTAPATAAGGDKTKDNPPPPGPAKPPPPLLHIDLNASPAGHLATYPLGHKDHIWAVALLPDGERVVSVSSNHFLKIWKVMTGENLRNIHAPAQLLSVSISSDGRYAATGCDDGHVRVWDLQTGAMKGDAPAPGKLSFGVGFSPDDRKVISVSHEKPENAADTWSPIQVWSWTEGGAPKPLEGWTHPIMAFAMAPGTPDGQFATAGNTPRVASELCVGSVDAPRPLRITAPLRGGPWRMAVSADHKYMAISFGSVASVYDFLSFKELSRFVGHANRIDCMRFLDGGRLLLTGSEDKSLRIWETLTGKELWHAELNITHATNFFAVNKDETLVVSGGGWGAGVAGQPPVNDADAQLNLWKLPQLPSLHSPDSDSFSTQNELATLPSIDPELAKLESEMEEEWQAKIVKEPGKERAELDKRYLELLQQAIPLASPSERPAYLDEISRAANNGPLPSAPPAGVPPKLQNLMKYYLERINGLTQGATAKTLLQADETRFSTLETLRRTQGDEKGAARVKRMWLQWSKSHTVRTG